MIVVNLRGNSGSGKTYTARAFMKLCQPRLSTILYHQDDQLLSYKKQKWVVLGRYSLVCGGADTIKTQTEIVNRIEMYANQNWNVFLEGLILSTIYGTVGAYSERFGDRWVFAYIQPPIEVLLERIRARRKAAGNVKSLNEINTRNRVATIARNIEIVREHGRRVLLLDWKNPLPALLKIARREG